MYMYVNQTVVDTPHGVNAKFWKSARLLLGN